MQLGKAVVGWTGFPSGRLDTSLQITTLWESPFGPCCWANPHAHIYILHQLPCPTSEAHATDTLVPGDWPAGEPVIDKFNRNFTLINQNKI
jgi:hypothetical protein